MEKKIEKECVILIVKREGMIETRIIGNEKLAEDFIRREAARLLTN